MHRRLLCSLTLSLALATTAAVSRADSRAAGAPALGGVLTGTPYTLTVASVTATKNQAAKATVVFKPVAGYHLNKDFPTGLKLTLPAGITGSAELTKKDAQLSEAEGKFEVTLTSTEPGKKTIAGMLSFAVCTATTCEPQKSPVAIVLDVK